MPKKSRSRKVNPEVHIIQSNADGNCIILKFDSRLVIALDLGLSMKRIYNYMIRHGINRLDFALLSHEHIDHVKSAKDFETKTVLISHQETLRKIHARGQALTFNKWYKITDNFRLLMFPTRHPGAAPGGFVIKAFGTKITYLTDTKYVFNKAFRRAQIIFIESNYGTELIASNAKQKRFRHTDIEAQEHLSLEEARRILKKARAWRAKAIYLIHMHEPTDERLLWQLAREFSPAKMTWPGKKQS